jgi:hypothetical protein
MIWTSIAVAAILPLATLAAPLVRRDTDDTGILSQ